MSERHTNAINPMAIVRRGLKLSPEFRPVIALLVGSGVLLGLGRVAIPVLFQQLIELENGGALDLSVGEFLTAEGESLAGTGLRPDLPIGEGRAGADRQLERAIENLRSGSR